MERRYVEIDPEIHHRLKVLAAQTKTTIQKITLEALLEKYPELKEEHANARH